MSFDRHRLFKEKLKRPFPEYKVSDTSTVDGGGRELKQGAHDS